MAFKIMLDAGHYGKYNKSPVNSQYYESEMTWKLHLLLKAALEKYGFIVGTTRKTQAVDLEVTKRGKLAAGYNLFISLHSNAASSPAPDHSIVFYSYTNLNNAKVLAENLSKTVAEVMQLKNGYKLGTRSHKFIQGVDEYYGVLRGAKNAGCPLFYIIEHSFHTNSASVKWLLDENNLKKLAEAEAETIAAYYDLIKPLKKGDIDGDGKITAKDYLLAWKAAFGTIKLTEAQFKAADIDGDGKITAKDCLMIKRAALGTIVL